MRRTERQAYVVGKTFVGIGFGPIQSGLFLLEAQASGNFERLVVAEVVPTVVESVRASGGTIRVNVAGSRGIYSREISGIEIFNPFDPGDVAPLIEAIAGADEIATALPSVDFYQRGCPAPAELLARGLERKSADDSLPRAIVYAAENHNHAAELLCEAIVALVDEERYKLVLDRVQFLNTVIGKMSGVVSDQQQIERDQLAPFVTGGNSAVLVEEFNRILISQVQLPGFQRGIDVFEEKSDLLPFEEAKLYGHNAAHALMGYLAHERGLTFMHESKPTDLFDFVRLAFLEESGGALCQRHATIDPLFTASGWEEYVDDLLVRMTSPYLQDRVDRVIRDPRRKLGWNDRLVGTMRLTLEYNIAPRRYARGVSAAVDLLTALNPNRGRDSLLREIWHDAMCDGDELNAILGYVV